MSDYMPKCATCEHFESCILQKHITEMALILWNISREEEKEREQTMSDRKRCCCNCRRCVRTWEGGNCATHCEIDGHYIGYVECFENWCRHWAKDKWQTEREVSECLKDT